MDKSFFVCYYRGIKKNFEKYQFVCQLLHNAHLTLHALGPASAGTGIRGLSGLRLILVLQFVLLGVQAAHSLWTLQLLVWLLNTLKENNTTVNTSHYRLKKKEISI